MSTSERVARWRAKHPEEAKRQTREAASRYRERQHERRMAIRAAFAELTTTETNDQ